MKTRKIGVMTGGGDCPGLNAVLRAVVKYAINKCGYEVIGFKDGYKGLVYNQFIKLSSQDVSGLLDKGGTILGTTNRFDPFKFEVDHDGEKKTKNMTERIKENLAMHDIDALIVIGGEGTLASAYELSQNGVNIVGVPKTIDNDIEGTDITFGYMTAVYTATEAIDKLHSTAESHHRVMILEVMGRNAGWIAIESGIAGGADVILIPEINYDINCIARKIFMRKNAGKSFSIIVVAEGAKPVGGEVSIQEIVDNRPDPIRLGGVGNQIAHQLEQLTGIESRVTVLGYLQRGGAPSPFDRLLSTRLGVHAIKLVENNDFRKMVSIKGNVLTEVNLSDIAGKVKKVNPDGELVKIARGVGVTFGDICDPE